MAAERARAGALLSRWRYRVGPWILRIVVTMIVAFLVLPTLIIFPISLGGADHLEFPPSSLSTRWYEEYFGDEGWIRPTIFSLEIAIVVTVVATIIGTFASLALVRGGIRGRAALNALIIAPLIVPVIIYAIAVLFVSAALYRVDPSLEMAAMSLGASRPRAIRRVTLPLVFPAVIAGAVFAFLASFDDATVSFFISGITDKSLPRKMFENVEFSVSPVVAVVSVVVTVISIGLLAVARTVQTRATPRAGEREPEISLEGADDWLAI
jgi:mannopine transport system permease protein